MKLQAHPLLQKAFSASLWNFVIYISKKVQESPKEIYLCYQMWMLTIFSRGFEDLLQSQLASADT